MLLILAKLGTPHAVGKYSLALAISLPIMNFSNLVLRPIAATDARQEIPDRQYIYFRMLTSAGALLCTFLAVVVLRYDLETALVIMTVGSYKSIDSVSDIFYGLLQRRERLDLVCCSMLIKGTASVMFAGMIMYLTKKVVWVTAGLVVVYGATLICFDQRALLKLESSSFNENRARLRECLATFKWDIKVFSRLFRSALPLGIVMTIYGLNQSMPRIFISRFLGERQLGIFAALSYFVSAGLTVSDAIGQSAAPQLATYFVRGDRRRFGALHFKAVGAGAMCGIGATVIAFLCGPMLLRLMYTKEYATQQPVFVWIMLSSVTVYASNILGYGLAAVRNSISTLPAYFATFIACAALCALLIPRYGLMGAACTVGVTALLTSIIFCVAVYRALPQTPN